MYLSVEDKDGAYWLTTPSGEEHQFAGIVDVARWATAGATRSGSLVFQRSSDLPVIRKMESSDASKAFLVFGPWFSEKLR
jgi:hypothetical protein